MTSGAKLFIILLLVGGVFAVIYVNRSSGKKSEASAQTTSNEGGLKKLTNMFSSGDDLTLGVNTWTGFAPIVWLNGGSLTPNKESKLYKDYGIKLTVQILDVLDDCRSNFKSGGLDVMYCTVDSWPVETGANGSMAQLGAEVFGQVDWSRGADLIVVDRSIKTVGDLRGKTVSVAEGTASNTLLMKILEANGMSMSDITVKKVADGIESAKLYKAGAVNAAVVWSPDDGDCIKAIPGTHVLIGTETAGYVIPDGLVAKKSYIEDHRDVLTKFMTAWLKANGEINSNPSLRTEAARAFAKAFNVDEGFAENGINKIRLATYGDNINFFGLNSTYQGVTGEQIYSKMSIMYSRQNLTSNPLAWRSVSNTSVIESISLNGSGDGPEQAVKFDKPTEDIVKKEAVSNKKVTINFATNQSNLDDDAKSIIDKEFVQIAKGFSGARVRIEGNTDATGNTEYNKVLSLKRAQSVANYLVSEYGFDPNKFIVIGNGSEKAIKDGVSGSSESYRMTEFQLVTE